MLDEPNAQCGSLLCCMGNKWLEHGMTPKKIFFFWAVIEIVLFVSSEWKFPPQLTSKGWIKCLLGLFGWLYNLFLLWIFFWQGSHKWSHKGIKSPANSHLKLFLWKYHLARNNLANFPMELSLQKKNWQPQLPSQYCKKEKVDSKKVVSKKSELKSGFPPNFKLYENRKTLFSSPFSGSLDGVNTALRLGKFILHHSVPQQSCPSWGGWPCRPLSVGRF